MNDTKTCPQCGRSYGDADRFCTVDGAALVAAGGASLIGTVVADRFLVQSKLGEGGMGEVYLAEHVRMKRKVALKLMRPWMLGDPVAVGRFHREAENASQISHPNVAQVYDFGETSERVVYLAMEFVDGEPLSSIMAREPRLHLVRTAEIVRQTAEALTAAHTLGILHRDLKPDNVMIARSRSGTDIVKLVDFGIARAMNRGTQQFTSTGLVVGTPDYMSPEQLSGDELDGRSDLYALALMAYRMLTGERAFPAGSSGEAVIARLTSKPRHLRETAPDASWCDLLQPAFERALAPDPAARFDDPMEFVAELDVAVEQCTLSPDEQQYLIALSQRHPTPVRATTVPTPTSGALAVRAQTPLPTTALLTPPERPRIDSNEIPAERSHTIPFPEAEPPTAAASTTHAPDGANEPLGKAAPHGRRWSLLAAGATAVAALGFWLTRPPRQPQLAVPNAAQVAAPGGDRGATPPPASPETVAPSASPKSGPADAELLRTLGRATLAVRSTRGSGAAVIADSAGIVLTAASLVAPDSTIDVFMDPNTLVRHHVTAINSSTGLATFYVQMRRCRPCAAISPSAIDPKRGDSVIVLPALERREGQAVQSAVDSMTATGLRISPTPRNALGAPVVTRTGQLLSLGVRNRMAQPSALRDAVTAAKTLRGRGAAAHDSVVPIWPERSAPSSVVEGARDRLKREIARYVITKGDLTVLVMTPQVLAYRASESKNPLAIVADPIVGWRPFATYVGFRRAVVAINAAEAKASFPDWSTKEVDFKRGDVTVVRLFRGDSLVVPIESSTFDALVENGKRAIRKSSIAVYSAMEFRSGDAFTIETEDARGKTRFPVPAGTLEAIRTDFGWLFR